METIVQWAGWISTIIACLTTLIIGLNKILKKLKQPMEAIKTENRKQTLEMERQNQKLDNLTKDVARLQGDRLNQAHDYYTQQGWCPGSKKRELEEWYNAYKGAGNNHLADHYMQDLINLPEHPV